MKKMFFIAILTALVLSGCSTEKENIELEREISANTVTQSENTVSEEYVMPEAPSEEYYNQEDEVTINIEESGNEPDYLVNGEWVFDMSTWEGCPYPEYNNKLDYALWNDSLLSDEEVENMYREQIEPMVIELLGILFNTEGETPDYTDAVMNYCVENQEIQIIKAFHHYYDQMEFTYETYKNSLIYYYSNNTMTVNGLAVIKSSSDILREHQRLHYIIPFTIELENIEGLWKIVGVSGFNDLYYGDTVQTYTNEENSAFMILGHKLISFDFGKYLEESEE